MAPRLPCFLGFNTSKFYLITYIYSVVKTYKGETFL